MLPRPVRVTEDFVAALGHALPGDRPPGVMAFLDYEMPAIVAAFSERWDGLPMQFGHPGYRLLIGGGRTVPAYSIVGQLAPDGSVDLVDISIDLEGLPEPDED